MAAVGAVAAAQKLKKNRRASRAPRQKRGAPPKHSTSWRSSSRSPDGITELLRRTPIKRTSTGYILRTANNKLRFSTKLNETRRLERPVSFRDSSATNRPHTASQLMASPKPKRKDGDESEPTLFNKHLFTETENEKESPLMRKANSIGGGIRRRLSTTRVAMLSVLLQKVSSTNLPKDENEEAHTPKSRHQLPQHSQSNFKALKLRSSITTDPKTLAKKISEAKPPTNCRQALAEQVVETAWFANVIIILVFMNALVMMFDIDFCWWKWELHSWSHGVPHDHALRLVVPCDPSHPWENYFIIIDWVFSILFTIEIIITAIALGERCPKSKWHMFDAILVIVADTELIIGLWILTNDKGDSDSSGIGVLLQLLSVLKLLRVFRIFRLVVVIDELRLLTRAFARSLSSVAAIFAISILIFFVFAIFATRLFGCKNYSNDQLLKSALDFAGNPAGLFNLGLVDGKVDFASSEFPGVDVRCKPHGAEYRLWFGNIPRSMYSLFQIMTLESWSMGIVRVVMEGWWAASLFFILFIGISTFVITNLLASEFVSKLLEVKGEYVDKEKLEKDNLQQIFMEKLMSFFTMMDTNEDGRISLQELEQGVKEIPDLKRLLIETGWITDELESVRHMFDIMDVNGHSYVEYEEFIQISDVFDKDILKEHVFQAHSNLVRRLKQLETLIGSLRETALPLIPNTPVEAQMVQRTVEHLLKHCDMSELQQIALSSPVKCVQQDAKAILANKKETKSSAEIDRSKLIQVISKHAKKTVLWWMKDPATSDESSEE